MRDYSQIIVGGGAAGFFGAIACAESHPHARVLLLEASHQPLAKVHISGGGRCNVTHACFDPALLVQHYPRGGRALRGAFSRFQPRDTVDWFQKRGVKLKTEADGRMFPVTNDSGTIVDCLMQAARQAGVEVLTRSAVAAVEKSDQGFELALKSGESLPCRRLLLTTGSSPQGYRLAESLGHGIEPPVPSLFTFSIPDPQLRELAGVAASAQVRLLVPGQKPLEQSGALLITHWGMSGPAVLKLSAWGARSLQERQYRAEIQVNWLPGESGETVRQKLGAVKERDGKKAIAAYSPFPEISRRLWQYLLSRAGVAIETRWADLPKKSLSQLVVELTQGSYNIQGKGAFKDEFVTCGGVRLKDVDFKTMESRLCPGLHFAGEILDIDGVTGGFNFQSAWTTGYLAGLGMN
jgi:hypothetical protein